MGHKKPWKGGVRGQAITLRGLRIYQKGDQTKTLGVKRWDVVSEYGWQPVLGMVCAQMSHM